MKKTATTEEIKSAYRQVSRQYHPDVNNGKDSHYKMIGIAYACLGDKDKRQRYDVSLLSAAAASVIHGADYCHLHDELQKNSPGYWENFSAAKSAPVLEPTAIPGAFGKDVAAVLEFFNPENQLSTGFTAWRSSTFGHDYRLDLRNMDLTTVKTNLTNMDFTNCDLRGANFTGCNLEQVKFNNSNLSGACFDSAQFRPQASFTGANFSGASFNETKLSITASQIKNTAANSFANVSLVRADFTQPIQAKKWQSLFSALQEKGAELPVQVASPVHRRPPGNQGCGHGFP